MDNGYLQSNDNMSWDATVHVRNGQKLLWGRHTQTVSSMFSHHTGEESECFQVLQDVAVLGGDEDHVEFLQRLVHVADAVCFHKGVLLARVHQFRECCQETLDTRPGHFHKLPRYDGLTGLGAYRRCQQHLQVNGNPSAFWHSLHRVCLNTESYRKSSTKLRVRNEKIRLTVSTFTSTCGNQNSQRH